MGWKKQVPDKEGYWIRLNAVHRPQLHKVSKGIKNRGLVIGWGWGGEEGLMPVKDIADKLSYFYWHYCEFLNDIPERDMGVYNRSRIKQ